MTNRRIKKSVIYGSYSLGLVLLIGMIYLLEANLPKKKFTKQEYSYVSKTIFDDVIPVIKTEEKIMKPFTATDIKEIKNYYDKKATEEEQQNAIIYYENTYMQNNGIIYGKDTMFDVVSVLPGTVEEIKNDELLGKIIKIKHNDNVSSLYQCLNEVTINKGDTVIGGQVIGQSGTCNIENKNQNNLHFELIINKNTANPNDYYGKTLNDIKG